MSAPLPLGAVIRETLEALVRLYAPWSAAAGGYGTGGVEALAVAFRLLGWADPHPYPADQCAAPGCGDRGRTMSAAGALCDAHWGLVRMAGLDPGALRPATLEALARPTCAAAVRFLAGEFPPRAAACDAPGCGAAAAFGLPTRAGWRDVCTNHARDLELAAPAEWANPAPVDAQSRARESGALAPGDAAGPSGTGKG